MFLELKVSENKHFLTPNGSDALMQFAVQKFLSINTKQYCKKGPISIELETKTALHISDAMTENVTQKEAWGENDGGERNSKPIMKEKRLTEYSGARAT